MHSAPMLEGAWSPSLQPLASELACRQVGAGAQYKDRLPGAVETPRALAGEGSGEGVVCTVRAQQRQCWAHPGQGLT